MDNSESTDSISTNSILNASPTQSELVQFMNTLSRIETQSLPANMLDTIDLTEYQLINDILASNAVTNIDLATISTIVDLPNIDLSETTIDEAIELSYGYTLSEEQIIAVGGFIDEIETTVIPATTDLIIHDFSNQQITISENMPLYDTLENAMVLLPELTEALNSPESIEEELDIYNWGFMPSDSTIVALEDESLVPVNDVIVESITSQLIDSALDEPPTNNDSNEAYEWDWNDNFDLTNNANDDFHANVNTTAYLEVDSSIIGNIETNNDVDWVRVDLTAGAAYQFDLEGASTYSGTLTDTYLNGIYDGEGNALGYANDDSGVGLNSSVIFEATDNAEYFVAVQSYAQSLTGTYSLGVTQVEIPEDDYSSDTTTTAYLDIEGSLTGNIETNADVDWVRLDLIAGTAYQFDLEGSPTESGTLSDTFLQGIYDSEGNALGYADDDSGIGFNSSIIFEATDNADYYVAVESYANSCSGTYSLAVTEVELPNDDFSNDTNTTAYVNLSSTLTGNIETKNDIDWVKVDLIAGESYQFDLEGSPTGRGTLSDTYIEGIYDSEGNALGYADDDSGVGYNSSVVFEATADAQFFVSIQSYANSLTGSYQLSVIEGDFASRIPEFTEETGIVSPYIDINMLDMPFIDTML